MSLPLSDQERSEREWLSQDHASDRSSHLRVLPPPEPAESVSCRHRYWVDRTIHRGTSIEQRIQGWAYCGFTITAGPCPHHGEPR